MSTEHRTSSQTCGDSYSWRCSCGLSVEMRDVLVMLDLDRRHREDPTFPPDLDTESRWVINPALTPQAFRV